MCFFLGKLRAYGISKNFINKDRRYGLLKTFVYNEKVIKLLDKMSKKAGKIMKKVLVGLLCCVLAVGVISGCGSKEKPKSDKSQNHTEEQKEQSNVIDTEPTEEEKELSKESEEEKDMKNDLTMQVLKDQAGTMDYTSLEELNPEPGSRIAVVVKNTKSSFWASVKKGMEQAVKDLNQKMGYKGEDKIKMSFEGPSEETDVESQINIIDAVLSENPSVLCLAAIDMESCEAQLEAAMENDISVIVLDSGVESSLVNAVCATDNYTLGSEAAEKLAEAVGGQGQIAVMTHISMSQTSRDREAGFTETIANNYPEIEIVNISHENQETSMTEMAEAVLKLYPDVKGYFGTNEHAANAVLDAVSVSGREVMVLGIDAGKKQMDAIKKGLEMGTFVQNSYGMGYATIVAAIRADLKLENDTFINCGYQWIDGNNIALPEYANYLYE